MATKRVAEEAVIEAAAAIECRLGDPSTPPGDRLQIEPRVLGAALKRLARERGGALVPFLGALLDSGDERTALSAVEALGAVRHERAARQLNELLGSTARGSKVRDAARKALYRLRQAGIEFESVPAPSRPLIARVEERAVRSWTSGIDGAGSRALWILFEEPRGDLSLLTLVVNDLRGILECAGGPISKKQLSRELQAIAAGQRLAWVECPVQLAVSAVADALAVHEAAGTPPPEAFSRWRPRFAAIDAGAQPPTGITAEPGLVDSSAELLRLPELAGWFVDPEEVQSDAVELLAARESRLVLNEQLKAEREAAIIDRAIDRLFTEEARRRWAKRLSVMAWIFEDNR